MQSARSTTTSGTSTSHRNQECILQVALPANYSSLAAFSYGVVSEALKPQLVQRLAGLCDPDTKSFNEHEMVFMLQVDRDKPSVQVRMRRRPKNDRLYWHCRYIGTPEVAANCPTIVRKTVDSMMYSTNMMEFVKALGLRLEYEILMDGILFTKGSVRITISRMLSTNQNGNYEEKNLTNLSPNGHHFVEASVILPENQDYEPAAKILRDFCDHLSP
ncbi:Mediator of RNA polymerase II transcription subunit 18 [Aphelenchoides fujianensis]|nr:Mediator of RNA polymerase II transcription subunit 18 [Aphelenchoides fujianensis]